MVLTDTRALYACLGQSCSRLEYEAQSCRVEAFEKRCPDAARKCMVAQEK